MKFGGTSVADADAMTRVVNIVRRQWESQPKDGKPPVVVVSALSKVTDGLIRTTEFARAGDAQKATALVDELLQRHVTIARTLTTGQRADDLAKALTTQFAHLGSRVTALAFAKRVTPADHDMIVATGELASSRIVAAAFEEQSLPALWVDAREVLVTDGEHTIAAPDMDATCRKAAEHIAPVTARQQIAVLGGFIASTTSGATTTLGRGGSDYSAAIFGACLGVGEIQIWTDVDGMLTADPRVVPAPRVVPHLSFAEASELAYFGAKVLHPATILPAVT
jgi:aspartate kinase